MSGSRIPDEPPPPYSQAAGSSTAHASSTAGPTSGGSNNDSSHLNVPGASSTSQSKDAIPTAYRRSMEDEIRPLPQGWVRTFDPSSDHQFFVDTTQDPPRSIWHHPYDDDVYLASLAPEERERIEQDSLNRGKHHQSTEDIIGAHSDDEDDHQHGSAAGTSASSSSNSGGKYPQELPPRTEGKGKQPDNRSFGRKFKDKVTGMTHEQRVVERKKRAEAEQRAYEQHLRMRQAMAEAIRTGKPQLVGKDRNGKDVYVEPPQAPGYGPGFGGYGASGYGYSPYVQPGVYSTPSGRYVRPQGPYGRPYGSGFGGGYGVPLGIGGGLLGGLLLGDMMAGGF